MQEVARELVRMSSAMGAALQQVAQQESSNDYQMANEMQVWSPAFEQRVTTEVSDLSAKIPSE